MTLTYLCREEPGWLDPVVFDVLQLPAAHRFALAGGSMSGYRHFSNSSLNFWRRSARQSS
jgi:hypothetical protein